MLHLVTKEIGIKNNLLSPEELVSLVLNENYSEQLPGGIKLRRSSIAGEQRIELSGAQSLADRFTSLGCFTEIIQYRKRVFIPANDQAPSILAAVINLLG